MLPYPENVGASQSSLVKLASKLTSYSDSLSFPKYFFLFSLLVTVALPQVGGKPIGVTLQFSVKLNPQSSSALLAAFEPS